MVSIKTHTPASLTSYIKSFWCLQTSKDNAQSYTEEILPDGHHEIVFHLNAAPSRKRKDSSEWKADPEIFFAGQNRKSYLYTMKPGTTIYGIRFHPHTQSLFYDFPASVLTDNPVAFSDIVSKDTLSGCITESPEKTFANFEKEIGRKVSRLKHPGDTFQYVEAAVRRIIAAKGHLKIDSLEKLTGVTSRHLEKSFQKIVGISPKHFSNIIRYGHFVNYRKQHPGKTLTECAYEASFHDQSHLIYLSHLITGHSPKSYFNKMNHINDFFLEA